MLTNPLLFLALLLVMAIAWPLSCLFDEDRVNPGALIALILLLSVCAAVGRVVVGPARVGAVAVRTEE